MSFRLETGLSQVSKFMQFMKCYAGLELNCRCINQCENNSLSSGPQVTSLVSLVSPRQGCPPQGLGLHRLSLCTVAWPHVVGHCDHSLHGRHSAAPSDHVIKFLSIFHKNCKFEAWSAKRLIMSGGVSPENMYLWKKLARMSCSNKTGYTSWNTPNKVRANNSYISCQNVLQFSLYLSNYICNTCITSLKSKYLTFRKYTGWMWQNGKGTWFGKILKVHNSVLSITAKKIFF